MMQTKRRDAAATIFSRVSAAPPPLISMPLRRRLVGSVDIQVELAHRIQIEFARCRATRAVGGLRANSRQRPGAVFSGLSALR